MNYDQVHATLPRVRGHASTYTCPCGKPARDWAYQHNGDPELYDLKSGRPYSEDLEGCYVAMCRSCHFKLDVTDFQRELGRLVGKGNAVRAAVDADFAAKLSEDRARAGRVANRIRRRCLDCGLTAHPAAVGAHLKGSGHSGYETI